MCPFLLCSSFEDCAQCTSTHCCHELRTCHCYTFQEFACKLGKVPEMSDFSKRIQCPLYYHQHLNKNVSVFENGAAQKKTSDKRNESDRKYHLDVAFMASLPPLSTGVRIMRRHHVMAQFWHWCSYSRSQCTTNLIRYLLYALNACHFVLQRNDSEFVSFAASFALFANKNSEFFILCNFKCKRNAFQQIGV